MRRIWRDPATLGWKAAEGSGCLVWWVNEPDAGEKVTWSGPCQGNRANGQGELVWQTGRYVGKVRDGKRHGRGTQTLANGQRYEGDFVANKLHGRGTYVWANGDRYEGDLGNSVQTGRGKMTKANGDCYD